MKSATLTDSLRETLAVFDGSGEPRTTPEVAERLGLGRRSTYARLERLVDADRLETKKVGANARVWWRPSPAGTQGDKYDQFSSLVGAVEEYAIFTLDAEGHVQTWNAGAERIKGYDAPEILGDHFSTFYTEEDTDAGVPTENLAAARRDGSTEDEGWRVRADGTRFWASVTITAIRDDDGALEGFTKVTRDMTQRRAQEEELRQQRDYTQQILETAPIGVVSIEPDGSFTAANQRAVELLALEADGDGSYSVGINDVYDEDGDYIPPEERPYVRAFETGESVRNWHSQMALTSGGSRWLSANIEPIVDEDGSVERVVVAIEDISQLKAQANRLERQRDQLESELGEVLGRVTDAFYALNDGWRFTHANEHAEELIDATGEGLIGKHVWESFEWADDSKIREEYERAMETQEATTFEAYHPAPLDAWYEIHAYPSESGLSVYFRDITDTKQRKLELERYEHAVEQVWDGVATVDADRRFMIVNDAFCEMTGYDREELLGASATLLLDEETYREVGQLYEKVSAGELDLATLEYDLQTKGGGSVPVEARFGPCEFEDGTVGGTGVIRDISDRKEREEQLELYETIVSTMDDGVYVLDEDYCFAEVNEAYAQMTGYDREELVGTHCTLVVDEDVSAESADMVAAMAADNLDGASLEADLLRNDGTRLRAESNFAGTPPESGSGHRKIGVVRDVSERVEREQILQKQVDQQRIVAELGRLALNVQNVDEVMAAAAEQVADGLDNDYCKVLDLDADAEELLLRQGVGWDDGIVGEATVSSVEADSQAAYTLETQGAVIVEDLDTESRFSGPDLLTNHDVASGISVIIGTHDDPWGILGTHDTDAREFTDEDVTFVRSVANILASAIQRRDREQELREANAQLEAATTAGEVGTWEYDVQADRFVAGDWLADTFGVDPETARAGVPLDELISSVHGNDRDRVEAAVDAAISSCGEYEEEYRVRDADGDIRWVVARGNVEADDDGEPATFPGALTDVTAQKRTELELKHQREELEALNDINEVVGEITAAVIDQSTRKEIEQVVCDALAAAETYEFAWLAAVDPNSNTLEPRATAGTRGYAEEISISMDPDDPASNGPGATAIRERETQVIQDVFDDPRFEPWRVAATEYGFSSAASIPVIHEETVYGVLALYADRDNAFVAEEREVISQLGRVVGHAIAAADRKRALMSDELVELEFRLHDLFEAVGAPVETEETITLDHAIPVGDDDFVVHGTADPQAVEAVAELVEVFPHWEAMTIRSEGDPTAFELRLVEPPILSAVSNIGGYFERFVVEDGDCSMTIHLAPTVEARRVIDAVQSAYPDAEMVRRQQVVRPRDDPQRLHRRLVGELTDKQRAVLDASYHSGYFEWPRTMSGEEIAESLDISSATFSQHLRKAEKKVFDSMYASA